MGTKGRCRQEAEGKSPSVGNPSAGGATCHAPALGIINCLLTASLSAELSVPPNEPTDLRGLLLFLFLRRRLFFLVILSLGVYFPDV